MTGVVAPKENVDGLALLGAPNIGAGAAVAGAGVGVPNMVLPALNMGAASV